MAQTFLRRGPTAPVVLRIDYGDRGQWVLGKEMVAPLGHPAHLTLCHDAMGIPAAAIGVTHSFEVVAEEKLAAVICLRDADSVIGCCVDCAADVETWGHLEVGGLPRFLRLGGGIIFPAVPSW